MSHRTEYVALLQEQHSQFLESINKAVSEDAAWEPQKCAIVPAEEPNQYRHRPRRLIESLPSPQAKAQ